MNKIAWKYWQLFLSNLELDDFKKVKRCIKSIEKQLFI